MKRTSREGRHTKERTTYNTVCMAKQAPVENKHYLYTRATTRVRGFDTAAIAPDPDMDKQNLHENGADSTQPGINAEPKLEQNQDRSCSAEGDEWPRTCQTLPTSRRTTYPKPNRDPTTNQWSHDKKKTNPV